ncbi:MAG: hypothetical protein V3S55_09390 [Nitrospiraceae bacterium]
MIVYHRFVFFSAAAACCLMSGCLATQKAVDEAFAEVRIFNDETRALADRTRSQFTISQGYTQKQIDDANAVIDKVVDTTDAVSKAIDTVEVKLEPLLTAEDLPEAVRGIGTIAAPYLGAYGGLAVLVTNALSMLLTRRRTQTTTTNYLIAPMEASRNRTMEESLAAGGTINAGTGGNFIVLNKDTLAPAHAANGAGALIKKATA